MMTHPIPSEKQCKLSFAQYSDVHRTVHHTIVEGFTTVKTINDDFFLPHLGLERFDLYPEACQFLTWNNI